jgi:acyl-CoA thioesterase FadM
VNNVTYLQWMQDAAMRHFEALGGTPHMLQLGATWVVSSHLIAYLGPAFAGEEFEQILRLFSIPPEHRGVGQ